MANILGAIQRQLQSIGFNQAGGVTQGSLTPANKYVPSEYKTASPSGTPAYQYSYGPGKPYYKDPGISGGPLLGGTSAGQPAMAGKPGGWTPDGTWSVGFQGVGPPNTKPSAEQNLAGTTGGQTLSTLKLTDQASKDAYQNYLNSIDTSNMAIRAEYNRKLQEMGADPSLYLDIFTGSPKGFSAQSNISQPTPMAFGGGATGGKVASGSWEAPDTSSTASIARRVQEGFSGVKKGVSGMFGTLTGKPPSISASGETAQTTQDDEGFLKAMLRRWIGGGKDNYKKSAEGYEKIGTVLGLPELKLSEFIAGGPTALTGQTPSSAQVFSPYRYTPEQREIDVNSESGQTPWNTQYSPGGASQLIGKESLIPQAPPPPPTDGGTRDFATPAVGDYIKNEIQRLLSTDPSELVEDTSQMDSWVEMAKASGLNDQQATLSAINKQVQVIADLLDNLDADITEESKNFLMTEGQRRRLIATRGKPLRDQLTKLVAGANKYGVNIKNTLDMLQQQIGVQQKQAELRLESQKAVEASKNAKLKSLTDLLPYMGYTTGGQQLSSKTSTDIASANAKAAMERALVNNQGGYDSL